MPQIKRPIGLTLDPDDYVRLQRYASDHHRTLSQAARVIVLRCLDKYDAQEGSAKATNWPARPAEQGGTQS